MTKAKTLYSSVAGNWFKVSDFGTKVLELLTSYGIWKHLTLEQFLDSPILLYLKSCVNPKKKLAS